MAAAWIPTTNMHMNPFGVKYVLRRCLASLIHSVSSRSRVRGAESSVEVRMYMYSTCTEVDIIRLAGNGLHLVGPAL